MEALRDALGQVLRRELDEKSQPLVRVCQVWPMLVGASLAAQSLPVRLDKKGVLTVRVRTSTGAQDLAHMKGALLPHLAPFGVLDVKTKVSVKAVSLGAGVPAAKAGPVVQRQGHEVANALRQALAPPKVEAGLPPPPEGNALAAGEIAEQLRRALNAPPAREEDE